MHVRKLRLQKVSEFVQRHPVSQWEALGMNLGMAQNLEDVLLSSPLPKVQVEVCLKWVKPGPG